MAVWAKYLISSNNPSLFLGARPFPSKILALGGRWADFGLIGLGPGVGLPSFSSSGSISRGPDKVGARVFLQPQAIARLLDTIPHEGELECPI